MLLISTAMTITTIMSMMINDMQDEAVTMTYFENVDGYAFAAAGPYIVFAKLLSRVSIASGVVNVVGSLRRFSLFGCSVRASLHSVGARDWVFVTTAGLLVSYSTLHLNCVAGGALCHQEKWHAIMMVANIWNKSVWLSVACTWQALLCMDFTGHCLGY